LQALRGGWTKAYIYAYSRQPCSFQLPTVVLEPLEARHRTSNLQVKMLRDEDEQRLPVEKMARIRRIMRMVAPFAQRLPGTKVVMDQEKNKMRSLRRNPKVALPSSTNPL
jgi:hypothetical protein